MIKEQRMGCGISEKLATHFEWRGLRDLKDK